MLVMCVSRYYFNSFCNLCVNLIILDTIATRHAMCNIRQTDRRWTMLTGGIN